ncbi:MAG: TonB-dependent receptor plug domain-containing protein [Tannerella sp.]|jgi:hypothetical protein|nr:TonB-dependent receptor plug domain-containing protein [Tannerella sp.]
MKFSSLIYLLFFSRLLSLTAQDLQPLPVMANLDAQLEAYPQEKIHIHTDRDVYVAGEKIWLKAYLIDAYTHLYPTHSQYVYVELIGANDSLFSRIMIRPIQDMFYGYIDIAPTIPAGMYTLRGYSHYMENMGDDYFFKKNIRIGNLAATKSKISTDNGNSTSTLSNLSSNDFDVSFFPEGGNLLTDIFCKVAFKALDSNGFPVIVSGEIIEGDGTAITTVQTFYSGMGVFTFIPKAGKKYRLKCKSESGMEKYFDLPASGTMACALSVSSKNKKLFVSLQQAVSAPDNTLYLLVHSRGVALYFAEWDRQRETVVFDENSFPAGVIQLLLFDRQMNPLSERLVFCKNYGNLKVDFNTDKTVYKKREKVIATIKPLQPSPKEGQSPSLSERVGVRCSIAITDDIDIPVDSATTILSSLLLSSELKGYIENQAYYLQDTDEATIALDYLMMTHGWRRYNIPEVAKGNLEYPKIPYQTGQEIAGHVKSLMLSKPVVNSEISMMTKDGFAGLASTDDKGRFLFEGFEYPDSTQYFIQALSSRGSDRVALMIDSISFPKPIHAPYIPIREKSSINDQSVINSETDDFIKKVEQRATYDEAMWSIDLSTVVATASRIQRKDEPRLLFPLNEGANATVRKEDFQKNPPPNVTDLLRSVPGVRIINGIPIIRNAHLSTFTLNPLPLVLLDGVVMEGGAAVLDELLTVYDIESIDVFSGSSAALFGARGSNGVISITLKRGLDATHSPREAFNSAVFTPLGYQKPIEFYSPRYDTQEAKQSETPDYRTTIFWKPDVVVSEAGETTFDFYTSDFPTTYSVVIEGMTTDGQIVRQVEKIQVE